MTDINLQVVILDLPAAIRVVEALESARDNSIELLADHNARLGRTTRANKATAKMYEDEVVELGILIELLGSKICSW